MRVERDEAAKKLAEAEEELADLKKQREKTIQKIESKREEYSAKGGDIYTQRQQLYSKRTGITSRIEALSERLVTDAASELPLLLVRHATGITQNVDDLLQSHTARTMLANSEFIVMLNQASTDRLELAKLLNISDTQLSYITNVDAGHGLIKVGSSLVPFANKFPKNTKLYKLMTTKPGEGA